jgi:TfoX/Sxy family transcriptional regulator of competence genes
MATTESFIKHVLDQVNLGSRFTCRKMFGEYGFHLDGKFVALACDNSFFIKETAALPQYGLELPTRSPYPGAKPYPVADELLDDPAILVRLLIDTAANLPKPKAKRPKKRKDK